MTSTLRKLFNIVAAVIVILWGAIFGFVNPFAYVWPHYDDLIRHQAEFPTSSIAVDVRYSGQTRFEEMIVNEIAQTGVSTIRFEIEHDYVGHAMPELLRAWRYVGDRWISVDEKVAISEVLGPLDMAEYMAGDHPCMFRFAVTHMSPTHACVMAEANDRQGISWEYWHLVRPVFGLGDWWIVSKGGVGWSY